jgi:tetratricopeptide (TPR) repeat protein
MIESVVNKLESSTELIALQTQIQQLLLESQYSQIISLCEQVINTKLTNVDFYCYLMLAYILQGQEDEAQATYILASIAQNISDKLEYLTERLLQVLDVEARRQVNIGNLQNSWVIRQYIKEIEPTLINNLLHLIQISINLKNFRPDFLKHWQVLEFMQP